MERLDAAIQVHRGEREFVSKLAGFGLRKRGDDLILEWNIVRELGDAEDDPVRPLSREEIERLVERYDAARMGQPIPE